MSKYQQAKKCYKNLKEFTTLRLFFKLFQNIIPSVIYNWNNFLSHICKSNRFTSYKSDRQMPVQIAGRQSSFTHTGLLGGC